MDSIRRIFAKLDILIALLVFPSAFLLKSVRRIGLQYLPHCRTALLKTGVLPILDHYMEPWFHPRHLGFPLDQPRKLPGISWNRDNQLMWLSGFRYGEELEGLPFDGTDELRYQRGNPGFGNGDAEILYGVIRRYQPKRIVEIGSGNSTLMAIHAIQKNQSVDTGYQCEMTCIEPYQMPWLEKLGVRILRNRLEDVDASVYQDLEAGDILFIDSSHMIRPQGDVLMEYLQILPTLQSGTIVHIHDIFSPRDYPSSWLLEEIRLWNEQYLVEAFLTCNSEYEILGALNWLKNEHYQKFRQACPWTTDKCQPGSLWIRKK